MEILRPLNPNRPLPRIVSLHPDVEAYPGYSHKSYRRIYQRYFMGAGLTNRVASVVSTRRGDIPQEPFLILADFELDYSTRPEGR